jgi:hypothetical protein
MTKPTLFTFSLLLAFFVFTERAAAQTDDRARAAAEIESLRSRIRELEATLLAPSDEDREAHADFLAQPRTGLVRLLPREKWDGVLSTRGGGSYYSFTRLTHEYGWGTHIGLERDNFKVGFAGADFGFITALGDAPLEEITTATEAVRFMADFKAPTAEAEARKAGRQFYPARVEGRASYSRTLPAAEGRAYVFRSINYDDSDVLVAFRVVRKDADGSVVLLWKLLKEYPKPTLERSVASGGR